jgi:hypothetical protein
MTEISPWDSIQVPEADFNVLQVPGDRVVPCFWGKDAAGSCLFVIELSGDHAAQFNDDIVTVNGLDVDLRSGGPNQQRLVLALGRQIDRDIFESLCRTLASALLSASDSKMALAVALAHLKRWKAFLAGRNARLLSPEEVRGLFGELNILRRLYNGTLPQAAAVDAWLGPDDSHQDFIFGDRAIEVKSLSGRERSTVHISSEDQLESALPELFLLTQRLNDMPETDEALSLNGIVSLIEGELSVAEAIEQFAYKLSGMGYVPLAEYDRPRFVVRGLQGYRVAEGFPRLIRSELPQGITRVAYEIMLEAAAPFVCDDADMFGRP